MKGGDNDPERSTGRRKCRVRAPATQQDAREPKGFAGVVVSGQEMASGIGAVSEVSTRFARVR